VISEGFLRHGPRLLILVGLVGLASVGVALAAQYQYGVKPCPWCILQRAIVLLIATMALVGGAVAWGIKKAGQHTAAQVLARGTAVPVVVLALGGLVAATYQNAVASDSASCAMTVADRIIGSLGLEDLWPKMFMITANCAEAHAYRLLGLPYEVWSGLLFAATLAAGLIVLLRGSKP
jgi:disulfide bond formation protein DsbB